MNMIFKLNQIKMIGVVLSLSALLIFPAACGRKQSVASQSRNENPQPVMVEELSYRPLDEYIQVSGKLEGITDVTMNSETSGRIIRLDKRLGDSVRKGENIGMVENEILKIRLEQARATLQSAQSAWDNAQRNMNYAEESYRRKLISEAEYNNAVGTLSAAQANLDGAKANLEAAQKAVDNSYLKAPESGVISNLFVSVGQFINPNQPIAVITDASRLIMKSGVGESQILKLRRGAPVIIEYRGIDKTFNGTLRGIGNRTMPNTATYPIEIELAGDSRLLPGMVVNARILGQRFSNLLYVPITYISKEFGRNYIFIVNDENKAEKRQVELGQMIDEYVVLLSGVKAGEKIVTTGVENLEDGASVQIRQSR